MFRFKLIASKQERTYGVMLRFLGLDLSFVVLGWLEDWRVIDLRVPVNYGVYLQIFGALLTIGRFTEAVWDDQVPAIEG